MLWNIVMLHGIVLINIWPDLGPNNKYNIGDQPVDYFLISWLVV